MSTPRAQRRRSERAERPARRGRASGGFWRGPWPYVVVGAVIVAAIAWMIASSRAGGGDAIPGGTEAADAVAAVTTVPADVLDKIAAGGVPDPLKQTSLAVLKGPSGRPLIVYVGAEYCPFCASERWSLIVALSRFGTFSGLSLTRSSSTDVYPSTPTFSFRGATYTSDVLELSAVETSDRQNKPLDQPNAVQAASYQRSDPNGSIPFVSIADRFVAVGTGYAPDLIQGKTWAEIGAALRDPASPIAKAVLGNANRITAAICKVTGNTPKNVCGSASVKGL